MTLEQIGLMVAIFGGVMGWIQLKTSSSERFAKLEVKVDTMWAFQMRRAESEAVNKGIASHHSPIEFNPKALAWFASMALDLRQFYAKQGRHLNSSELYIEIERQFGDRMLRDVCIPNGLTEGACLLIAAKVAAGEAAPESI